MMRTANGEAVEADRRRIATNHGARLQRRTGALAAVLAVLFFLAVSGAPHAQAQTESIVHSFTTSNNDGEYPFAGLVTDMAGNLYGTTSGGGLYGHGTVFELVNSSGTYTETVLYSFTDSNGDGANPHGKLILDSHGNIYGTTYSGGSGYGTVFELVDSSGVYTPKILYAFTGVSSDGANPYGGLVMDSSGNLYGTTVNGGSGYGTVFELVDSSGVYTPKILHAFTDASGDGASPNGGLVMDSSGNLYGTTVYGGASESGTVFKVNTSGQESVLYSFTGQNGDGAYPYARLIMNSGNLYGTTAGGGTSYSGTVFKVNTSGQESVLYSFTGTNGASPRGSLAMDGAGNLYGTTVGGGTPGYGTVFELVNSSGTYTEKVLYDFTDTNGDGIDPYAGLVMGPAGNFYGTTLFGGSSFLGTVYEIATSVPFSAFSAKLDITAGQFQLNGAFTLGNGATSINPVTQSTKLAVGTYSVTIPAGSFVQQNNGNFNYQGTINGVSLAIEIKLTGANAYSINVEATGETLTSLSNPVPVTLSIGNNTGTTQVTAQF